MMWITDLFQASGEDNKYLLVQGNFHNIKPSGHMMW